ncbi:MAG: S9 family peptidase [Candidatus Hydrothermae bacterium]|nr:S9 family peptidase [Candidatus Hydrothermae bacterium]
MPRARVTPRTLAEFSLVGGPVLSPDGRSLVYTVTRLNFARNRYETRLEWMDLRTKERSVLWSDPERRVGGPVFWSPDGRALYFTLPAPGKKKRSWLYRLWMDRPGEPEKVLDPRGHIDAARWSPDGTQLVLVVSRKKKREPDKEDSPRPTVKEIDTLFHKLDTAGYLHHLREEIVLLDVQQKKSRTLFRAPAVSMIHQAVFRADGRGILFAGNLDEDAHLDWKVHLYALPLYGGAPTRILEWPGSIGEIFALEDAIYFVGDDRHRGFASSTHLWRFQPGQAPEDLLADLDRSIGNTLNSDVRAGGGRSIDWDPAVRRFVFRVQDGSRSVLMQLDPATGQRKTLNIPVGSVEGVSARAGRIVIGFMTFTSPAELYEVREDRKRLRPLTQYNTEVVRRYRFREPLTFRFTTSDGQEMEGFVLPPRFFRKDRTYPVVLEIHGGPRTTYGYAFLHEFHLLTQEGFAVVFLNPRGSAGFGEAYAHAVTRHYGERDYQDLMEGLDAALETFPFLDPERVGVTGGSYGGFMTNWIVGHTDRFRAAVTQRSIANFLSFYGTSDIGWLFALEEVGGLPWDILDEFWKRSPIRYAPQVKTPLLIIHAEEDHRCPVEQADQWFTALKVLGKEVRYLRFEGESHELSRSGKPLNRERRLQAIVEWFQRYLKEEA